MTTSASDTSRARQRLEGTYEDRFSVAVHVKASLFVKVILWGRRMSIPAADVRTVIDTLDIGDDAVVALVVERIEYLQSRLSVTIL